MDFLKHHRTSITTILVLIIAFVLYGFFFAGGDDEVLVSESELPSEAVGADLLNLLLTLQSLTLDESIFENETFMALVDFGVELSPEPVGRPNPFAPLGVSSAPAEEE